MKKIFMFVNVDWFFLSHRLPIAEVASARGYVMKVFADFTRSHLEHEYGDFSLVQSPIGRGNLGFFVLCTEIYKTLQLIRYERPDVIHAVTLKPILFLGVIALILKTPFIASISGLGPAFSPSSRKEKLRLLAIKFIYRLVFSPEKTKVICQSQHDAQVLTDNGLIAREKITMIEGSGIDLDQFRPKEESIVAKSITVLMASRLLVDKGVKEFCFAANMINETYDFKVRFRLAGPVDPMSPGSLSQEEVTKMCNMNNVEFLGNRSDLKAVLAATDIFVLPSYYAEGVPKVLQEAAACGCAIVTTDHPGCRDAIIAGHTGLLVKPKDVSSLMNSLAFILKDQTLMKSMGRAGRKMAVKRFSITNVVDLHYSLYRICSGAEA